ncbi:DNA replication complex GINS family protein [Candidatus Bathyarchaeota archaeon]|nr:DNA replication complex GINS family protein [Candidatus Bathyarchaeota archaeon]
MQVKKVSSTIKNLDFSFENSLAKIVANRNCPEIKLAGLKVGPFEEGNEYEVKYWVARELVKSGIARFREEEMLDAAKLHKIQWKERVQTTRQISKLPEDFYPKLRRYLVELRQEITKKPEKMREYEKVRQLTQDIINSRLKKIVSLASAPAQTERILKNFATEERFLYEENYKLISEWRTHILKNKEGEK